MVDRKSASYVVGATSGLVVGGGASAAVGYTAGKAISAIASTRPAVSIGARFVQAAPRVAARLPGIATVATVGLSAYTLFQAVRPLVANAAESRKKRTAPSEPPEKIEVVRERLGAKFGGYDKRLEKAISHHESQSVDKAHGPKTRDWHKTRELALRTELAQIKGESKPEATPAAPPPKQSLVDEIKGLFAAAPNPEREQLVKEIEATRTAIANEISGKNVSGQKGAGKNYDKLVARQRELEGKLETATKTERDNSPLKQGFQTFAPIGASLGGYLVGSKLMSGAGELAKRAEGTAKAIGTLGKKAEAILRSNPRGVIAGTTAGDKAKAVVNEAYARGGAKPAFASPGYPATTAPAQQVFASTGQASRFDYVPPAFNAAAAGIAGTISVVDTNENRRAGERVVAGFEAGLAIGQWKALAGAAVIRPAASAISSIEGLRNRIVRETATRAPSSVAQTRAATNASMARIAAGRTTGIARLRADGAVAGEKIRAGGRIAATRLNAQSPAIAAGTKVGVAKADGAGKVARAEARNKLGPAKAYKNTWQDSRGRIYHRKDMSVRAANGNSPPNSSARRRQS